MFNASTSVAAVDAGDNVELRIAGTNDSRVPESTGRGMGPNVGELLRQPCREEFDMVLPCFTYQSRGLSVLLCFTYGLPPPSPQGDSKKKATSKYCSTFLFCLTSY